MPCYSYPVTLSWLQIYQSPLLHGSLLSRFSFSDIEIRSGGNPSLGYRYPAHRQNLAGCPAFQGFELTGIKAWPLYSGASRYNGSRMLTSVPLLRGHSGSAPSFGAGTLHITYSTSVLQLKSQHTFDRTGKQGSHRKLVIFTEAYGTYPFILAGTLPKMPDD